MGTECKNEASESTPQTIAVCGTHGPVFLVGGVVACPLCKLQADLDEAQQTAGVAMEALARVVALHGGEIGFTSLVELPKFWRLEHTEEGDTMAVKLVTVPFGEC